ncbi:hypothetical protein OG416_33915 [Streptomyces longwoodensis]|uniref:hypothetical protein n=1 Tax=Streptomyces longwoodensis TaxID=68231 RepID=UPI0030DEE2CE|nr:hypothetical protein OG416_33915 [Streptomyces longwoodensis]
MELISRRTIGEEMRAHGRAVTFTVFEDADRLRGRRPLGTPPRRRRDAAARGRRRGRTAPVRSPAPAAGLRDAVLTALDAIQTDPAGVKAHEAVTATCITDSRTHRSAAHRLGGPYGTYHRHLALAKERLVERLLRG